MPSFSRSKRNKLSLPPTSTGFLHGLLIGFEDGDDILLRSVGLPPNYTVIQLRRQDAS